MAAITQRAQENGAIYRPQVLSDFEESITAPIM